MSTVSQLEQAVEAIFGNADHLARETGFVQRVQKGKLSGKRFAVTQTLGLLVPGGGSMSDLAYFATHGMCISVRKLSINVLKKRAGLLEGVA